MTTVATRWLIIDTDNNGDWQIDAEPGRELTGGIMCTFQTYAEAQRFLTEYHFQQWYPSYFAPF